MAFLCPACGVLFSTRTNLNRHLRAVHGSEEEDGHICDQCGVQFHRRDNLKRHMVKKHTTRPPVMTPPPQRPQSPVPGPSTAAANGDPVRYQCQVCNKSFNHLSSLSRHKRVHRRPDDNKELERAGGGQDGSGGEHRPGGAGSSNGAGCSGTARPHSARYANARNPGDQGEGAGEGDGPSSPTPSSHSDSDSSARVIGFGGDGSGPSTPGSSGGSVGGDDIPIAIPDDLAPEGFEEMETGFRGRLKTYHLVQNVSVGRTIPEFLNEVFDQVVELLGRVLHYVHAVKVNFWLDCEFKDAMNKEKCRRAFKTQNTPVFRASDLEELCHSLFQKMITEKEECAMKGSGWAFLRILDFEIRVNVFSPLGGSSYVPLPPEVEAKKAVINVINHRDHRCFVYAVLTRYIDNPHRGQLFASDFTQAVLERSRLDFSDLDFPVPIEKISVFEKKNGVSVNVYGLEKVKTKLARGRGYQLRWIVYPLRVAKEELPYPDHFDLLYLTDDETSHYAYISDFSRLVHSQVTARNGRLHICKRCFAHFDERPTADGLAGAQRLAEHKRYCKEHAPLRTDISEKKEIRFEKHERTQRVRFTIYADFECAHVPFDPRTRPADEAVPSGTVPPPDWDPAQTHPGLPHQHRRGDVLESASVTTQKVHKPYAYAYFVHDSEGRNSTDGSSGHSVLVKHRGPDAAQHFMNSLRNTIQEIGDILYAYRRDAPQLTAVEEAAFRAATDCYLCGRPFDPARAGDKVRDHQHSAPYTYRGAACRQCNLRYREQDVVNCYFHNLSNYDAHFVVRELGLDSGDVSVLANNEERYIAFTKQFHYPGAGRHDRIAVRFVDSYRFLSKALATLATLLPVEQLVNTRRYFPLREHFELVRRKGVFPYEYVNSIKVLDDKVLPPPATFYDSLRMEGVTREDYEHAQRVWIRFGCRTLGDYADVYLKTDVMLLTDVFESFRDMCLHHYGLDPAHWITLPSYAWDVMLYKTGVTLDTLQDVDQYLFFEKGIRGGLAQCVTRHTVANNKYTRGEGQDAPGRDDDTYIMYYDANNLYGWAMSQPLPYGEFQWLSEDEIAALDIETVPEDSPVGYVLEVDLEYPRDRELQERHRDLPFCPEVAKAPVDRLPYPPELIRDFGVGRSKKLMATQMDKVEYVIHYRLLQQALDNGLRIRRVHRVLRFKQTTWLKPYVSLNTELRRQAKNKFEVELFKLMVNAVYGMSLQNVRKHIDIRLATSPRQYTRYVARPNFGDRTWYRENLALLHMAKVRVVLDKPVYAGMAVLDHSKWWMYGFHYKMVSRYGVDRIRLAYMDTDSLLYTIKTRDVYSDMLDHADDFDTSNYPRGHRCYSAVNARVLGKFKDEADGKVIKEFVGLGAKLYSVVFHQSGDTEGEGGFCAVPPPIKKAKGVNRAVVARDLTVEDYKRCLFDLVVKYTENKRFQSRHHLMYSVTVRKRSLAPFDDKRFVVMEGGGVSTLPWGHHAIPEPPQLAVGNSPIPSPALPPPLEEDDDDLE